MKKKITKTTKRKTSHPKKSSLHILSKNFLFVTVSFCLVSIVLTVASGVISQLQKNGLPCANSVSCIDDLSGKITNNTSGNYMGQRITAPDAAYFAGVTKYTNVLGAQTGSGAKHIYVDLSSQHLYAYQGNTLIFNDLIASGKWNLTPTGTFAVWVKLQATLMAGGEGATAYYLPNVPWTMYFANAKVGRSQGYSMHGEYWYNPDTGLGKPESHGCINMRISDAKALYDWIDPPTTGYTTHATDQNPGTLVTIYGTTPNSGLIGSPFYNNNVSFDAGSQL